jgi:hypothetical protein
MGWENHQGRSYYYRKRREGKRVVSEYIGTGADAVLIAQWDGLLREQTTTDRAVKQLRQAKLLSADQALDDIFARVELLTKAALVASGHHQHKGSWRRIRYVKTADHSDRR